MDIFREQKFACFLRESIVNLQFILSYQIMIVNIKSIQYKIAFNKKSILYTVNYMIIRKVTMLITHNITHKWYPIYRHMC